MNDSGSVMRPTLRGPARIARDEASLLDAIRRIREPVHLVRLEADGRLAVAMGGEIDSAGGDAASHPWVATLPAMHPEWLGDRSFAECHGVRFPYVVGEMANGIATARMVVAGVRAGFAAFFGAAGLEPARVETAIDEIEAGLGADAPGWGANLIHSPDEPALERAMADLYVRRGVRRVSTSAFMSMSPSIVHCAAQGLRAGTDGSVVRQRHVIAKVSRAEVAEHFLSPAPHDMLDALVREGRLTASEAALASRVPVAEDVTVEADSGGHTDNRPLTALLPILLRQRDRMAERHGYDRPVRIGAAGGLGTPGGAAAAFALGAAYVLTGSVNQCAVESGLSAGGREMLAQAGVADVVMAPAADMFELGVKVQVLRRGTMFGARAQRLHELYSAHESLEAIGAGERTRLERDILGMSCELAWEETRAFWLARDPAEAERGERDPRARMALVFRSYLGRSSKWAIEGDEARRADWQIWCGPAMGAFNDWARGSFLEDPSNRTVAQMGLNLLEGAAVLSRAQQLRSHGIAVPGAAFTFLPRELA